VTSRSGVLSVIMPVRNESVRLREAISEIREAIGSAGQVVVVDNESTDGSMEIAVEFADVVIVKAGTVGACRVAGVEASSGDLILFVDADQVLSRETVDSAIIALSTHNACAVVIPERPVGDSTRFLIRALSAEREMGELAGAGIPRLVKREVYLKEMSKIDGMVFAEDWILTKLTCKTVTSSVPILHDELGSIRALFVKYRDYGWRASRAGDNPPSSFGFRDRGLAFIRYLRHVDRSDRIWLIPVLCLKMMKLFALLIGYSLERLSRKFPWILRFR
jgi:glycosyltransferase involved in cell wall biosynthesis